MIKNTLSLNIYVLSGVRPITSYKDAASFIEARYTQLILKKININMYILSITYSKIVQFIYSIISKKEFIDEDNMPFSSEPFHQIRFNSGFIDQILIRLLPGIHHKFILRKIDSSISPDPNVILHGHWIYPHGYYITCLAKKYNVPCVVTAHGSDIHTIPRRNRIIKKYTLDTLESADKIIFVSKTLLASAKELGYSGENAVVIPNGIDPTYFYPVEKETAMEKTGWKQSKKYVVGFVGNLIYVKRADKFVKIFSEIQKIIGDVEFVLVGDGDLREEIQNECSELGVMVTFAGRVPHEAVAAWMNLFDVMILPSRNEGWPCVVLEAYACGVPVVGSNNGGIAEALGGLGVVVEEGNGFVEGFAKGVCDVLMGVHPTDSSELVKHAAKYTWESLVSMEIDVYTSLMDREISGDEN